MATDARTHHENGSEYTLATVDVHSRSPSPASERSQLLSPAGSTYGAADVPLEPRPSRRRLLLRAGLTMAAIFVAGTMVLGGTLWLALPTLDE
jgi:hypothetical protein